MNRQKRSKKIWRPVELAAIISAILAMSANDALSSQSLPTPSPSSPSLSFLSPSSPTSPTPSQNNNNQLCADGAARLPVAVASNFKGAAIKIARAFARKSNCILSISSGATGALYTQIMNGAPFVVFFAADSEHPRRLEQAQRIVPGSRFTYAHGQLAMVFAPQLEKLNQPIAPPLLLRSEVRRIAIANPEIAPYGAAAREALIKLKIWRRLENKYVIGNNVLQARQFLVSGNAQAALLPVSLAINQDLPHWLLPRGFLNTPLEHQMVILKDQGVTHALSAFMRSFEARDILERQGYLRNFNLP